MPIGISIRIREEALGELRAGQEEREESSLISSSRSDIIEVKYGCKKTRPIPVLHQK